ncbi:murein hydrolase regulator [Erwinia sp. Ejp617]|nr:murein hydrolase regulator [Erwinia sp. Ejp617]
MSQHNRALATRQQTTGWLQRVQVPLQVALYIAIFIISAG